MRLAGIEEHQMDSILRRIARGRRNIEQATVVDVNHVRLARSREQHTFLSHFQRPQDPFADQSGKEDALLPLDRANRTSRQQADQRQREDPTQAPRSSMFVANPGSLQPIVPIVTRGGEKMTRRVFIRESFVLVGTARFSRPFNVSPIRPVRVSHGVDPREASRIQRSAFTIVLLPMTKRTITLIIISSLLFA